jgi:hypothetical protein
LIFFCVVISAFFQRFWEIAWAERGVLRGKSWWICGDFVVERTALNGAGNFPHLQDLFLVGPLEKLRFKDSITQFRGNWVMETGPAF